MATPVYEHLAKLHWTSSTLGLGREIKFSAKPNYATFLSRVEIYRIVDVIIALTVYNYAVFSNMNTLYIEKTV